MIKNYTIGLSLLVLSFVAPVVHAQSNMSDTPKKTVYLNSVLGVSFPGLSSLNAELKQAGFLPLSGVYFTRGAGFYTIFPRARLATIFNFSSYSGTNTDQNRSTWVRGSTAGTSLGFVLRNTNRVQIIPYAGVVYSWFGTRVSKIAPGSTAFSSYLAGPANQQQLSTEQFMVNLGLHLSKHGLGRGTLAQKLLIGVRAGYLTPLGNTVWKTNNVSLSGGPSASSGGLYAHLILGGAL